MEIELTVDQDGLAKLLRNELNDLNRKTKYFCIYGDSWWGKNAIVNQTLE